MIAIYIHWPFCLSKCPYCDFNSHVRERIDINKWKQAYLKQIDYYQPYLKDKIITSIFFGGGTPSLMPPDIAQAIIEKLSVNNTLSHLRLDIRSMSVEERSVVKSYMSTEDHEVGRRDNQKGIGYNIEITLEANPTSVEAGKFKQFKEAVYLTLMSPTTKD